MKKLFFVQLDSVHPMAQAINALNYDVSAMLRL